VVRGTTSRSPWEIQFHLLRGIETTCGRMRTNDRCAPRTLDLDLLAYGDLQVHAWGLVLPDADIFLRAFWAVPLCDLDPDRVFCGAGRSMREIVGRMDTGSLKEDAELTQSVRRLLGAERICLMAPEKRRRETRSRSGGPSRRGK
jgi:2-amino-4-hydroxy-6-hydroxymethyldihydropteridine diphosphokinase